MTEVICDSKNFTITLYVPPTPDYVCTIISYKVFINGTEQSYPYSAQKDSEVDVEITVKNTGDPIGKVTLWNPLGIGGVRIYLGYYDGTVINEIWHDPWSTYKGLDTDETYTVKMGTSLNPFVWAMPNRSVNMQIKVVRSGNEP